MSSKYKFVDDKALYFITSNNLAQEGQHTLPTLLPAPEGERRVLPS